MKPFAFRADVALALRRRQEEEAQKALAVAMQRVQDAHETLAGARTLLAGAIAGATRTFQERVDLSTASWYRNWIEQKRREVARADDRRRDREREAHDARQEASAARRRVRALERLRERAHAAHRQAERHEEQGLLDELGARQYANRQLEDERDG